MTTNHVPQLLGAYVLGALDGREVRAVEDHVATCAPCRAELAGLRAMEEAMGDVPPEALLDGPPDGGDLLLQRTLRQVRAERGGRVRRRRVGLGLAAAAVAAVVLGGGFAVGRGTAPDPGGVAQTGQPPAPPAGTRVGTATDPETGARMTVQVKPAAGWVRVNASVAGIAQNEKCRLFVVAKDGSRQEAGSWLVSSAGEKDGTNLDGSALIAPEDVQAVEVRNFDGEQIVTVPV
ncbi:zf-HC2 domain-containing protein [Saccharothrix longispora]|uniref:anti-sigma factor family protein n=1 Tax=Saccharothrix longispora TaxID=33920 RepID=UPI0028FDBDCD|nr:zf-HC2 domain-containing protein [Saccharothrix longispora]MDU0294693.1 zf-HC2 domain-containing protein [Saccharothrix longispora]